MWAMISFGWNENQKIREELSKEQQIQICRAIGEEPKWETDEDGKEKLKNYLCTQFVAKIEDVIAVGVPCTVLRVIDMPTDSLMENIERLEKKLNGAVAINQKCSVQIPGQWMMKIKKVMALPDACTEELQTHIDEGWKVMAICVQPDQRRPDYILGRCK